MRESHSYIGVKLIKGTPMTRGEYNKQRGLDIPKMEDPADDGYFVEYPDGYVSWCPKVQFETANYKLNDESGRDRPVINKDDVELFVSEAGISPITDKSATITLLTITGHEIHHTATCAHADDYDADIACNIGYAHNMERLSGHLQFMLDWAINGIENDGLTGPNKEKGTKLKLAGSLVGGIVEKAGKV